MKRKFTHKQIIVGLVIASYLAMVIGGIITIVNGMFNGNIPDFKI